MNKLLRQEESAVFALRELYSRYGYSYFKMSKFEEYDLYVGNKDFLQFDGIISFTDTSGRLMALKPDVTLSILKNTKFNQNKVRKLYYNENVYRVSKNTGLYKEIMQAGLECVGDVSSYDCYEVLELAVLSLNTLATSYVLDVSHMGFINAYLDLFNLNASEKKQIISYISAKNMHDLRKMLGALGAEEKAVDKFIFAISISENIVTATKKLQEMGFSGEMGEAVNELIHISNALNNAKLAEKVNLDFSVINDMNYYSGLVFKGFIDGIPSGILSGGRYDKLTDKISRGNKAIGFAVYLDLLGGAEKLRPSKRVALLTNNNHSVEQISEAVKNLRQNYDSVRVVESVDEGKFDEVYKLDGTKVVKL